MEDKMINYENALKKLSDSLNIISPDEVQIDGIIQRFEFTFELAWKLLKKILKENDIVDEIIGAKGILRIAYNEGLIKNGDIWIQMLDDRNNTSHRYDYDKSREIYDRIRNDYIKEFNNLEDILKRRI